MIRLNEDIAPLMTTAMENHGETIHNREAKKKVNEFRKQCHTVRCFDVKGYNKSFIKIPEREGPEVSHTGDIISRPSAVKSIQIKK